MICLSTGGARGGIARERGLDERCINLRNSKGKNEQNVGTVGSWIEKTSINNNIILVFFFFLKSHSTTENRAAFQDAKYPRYVISIQAARQG